MALPVKNRIKKTAEFDNVFRNGKTVLGAFLFLRVTPGKGSPVRFGFIVPAAVFGNAVRRNELKRVLSEVARARVPALPSLDILVVLNKRSLTASTGQLGADLEKLLKTLER